MAWPTSKPDSTAFDNADDSIRDSRAEIKTMSDAVNDIVDFVDTTGISNGQALVYDSASGTIKPGAAGAFTTNNDSAGDFVQANTNKLVLRPTGMDDSAGDQTTVFVIEEKGVGHGEDRQGWRIGLNDKTVGGTNQPVIDFVSDDDGTKEIQFFNYPGRSAVSPRLTETSLLNWSTIGADKFWGNELDTLGASHLLIQADDANYDVQLKINTSGTGAIDFQCNTATSATAGAQTLPANPQGFLMIKINGVAYKVPYYNT